MTMYMTQMNLGWPREPHKILLYGTGIRVSECSSLREKDVDLKELTIIVVGKGGDERVIPLNEKVAEALGQYRIARSKVGSMEPFFRSRKRNAIARRTIYDRVKKFSILAQIKKKVSPHRLRHTFATHLLKQGENLATLKSLLGHRHIQSTQLYVHMTGEDLRAAISRHPIDKLVHSIKDLLPGVKLPFQHPPGTRFSFR